MLYEVWHYIPEQDQLCLRASVCIICNEGATSIRWSLTICGTLWNRAGHYIFVLWFLLSFFLTCSGRRLDVYHISIYSVALVRI